MRSGPILAVLVHFFSRLPLNFVSPCPPDCYYKAKQKLSLISGYESRGGSSAFWLPTSNFRLPTCDFQLQTSDLRLHRSNFRLQTWQSANSVFLISDFRLPISHYWFPASDFWLDSSVWLDCRSIHHAGINARSQSSVERTAVPFSPQKRTSKLALEKATKHKANPATDEVLLENQNHGLAWPQSGSNNTVQTLAVNLILACLTGALWAKRGERGILRKARNECEALRS